MIFNLLKSLHSLPLDPIIVVLGPDSWLRQKICQSLMDRALDSAMREMNFSQFHAKEDGIAKALQACGEYPCFAEKRVVFVKSLEKISKAEVETFKDYLKNPQPSTLLLLELEKLDGRLDWVKLLKKQARILEFDALSTDECIQWVKLCFKREAKSYTGEVPALIVELIGKQFGMLQNTVQQLCLYVGELHEVSQEDCHKLLSKVSEENIFEVIEAVFSDDFKALHQSLGALLDSGEAPLKILALAYRHLSILLEIKFAKAGEAVSISPWLQRKYQTQVNKFSNYLNYDLLKPLVVADEKLKSSSIPSKFILQNSLERLSNQLRRD
ncbi:MAG: DNA polymerase III subunit delta [Deltaproteobacteria bacterium]|nr:DNA polymerase III subunit delta [Deltaproteobacteria bacterium]